LLGVHGPALTHAPQVPAAQTPPDSHGVPSATGPMGTHIWAPVEQSVRPATQVPAGGVHGWFTVHAMQTPRSHTAFAPHVVPFVSATAVAVHLFVEQSSVPS
jgi:hypothetical protein